MQPKPLSAPDAKLMRLLQIRDRYVDLVRRREVLRQEERDVERQIALCEDEYREICGAELE